VSFYVSFKLFLLPHWGRSASLYKLFLQTFNQRQLNSF